MIDSMKNKTHRFNTQSGQDAFRYSGAGRMALIGKFGEEAVKEALHGTTLEDRTLPVGDFQLPLSKDRFILAESKTSSKDGTFCPVPQLEASPDTLVDLDGACGALYTVLIWSSSVRRPGEMPLRRLRHCKTPVDVFRGVTEGARAIVIIDAQFLCELVEMLRGRRAGRHQPMCELKERHLTGNTRGQTLVLHAPFYQAMRAEGGDWAPNALGLANGWVPVAGSCQFGLNSAIVRRVLPTLSQSDELVDGASVRRFVREIPILGLLSAQTSATLAAARGAPLRQQLGLAFRPRPAAPAIDPDSVPF